MFKITIIGWYGTETIGDRAILAGVLKLINDAWGHCEIQLGSILPFFTERTLIEDESFLKSCSGDSDLKIELFDSANPKELDNAIKWADNVVIGGGPLEDIPSMFMLEYAFKKAKRMKKRTVAIGCGVGPIYKKIYQKSMVSIVNHADVAVFRDEKSLQEYKRLGGKNPNIISSIDPAVFALKHYQNRIHGCLNKVRRVVISVREFPSEYKISNTISEEAINKRIIELIRNIQEQTGMDITLVPMHYFGIGDDDRYFMNDILFSENIPALDVNNRVLTMEETMELFATSEYCVGMRFHSVVFQTLLSGKNIIWDYTDLNTGKIGAFLSQIGGMEFYKDSYLNLQTVSDSLSMFPDTAFSVSEELLAKYERNYIYKIRHITNK